MPSCHETHPFFPTNMTTNCYYVLGPSEPPLISPYSSELLTQVFNSTYVHAQPISENAQALKPEPKTPRP